MKKIVFAVFLALTTPATAQDLDASDTALAALLKIEELIFEFCQGHVDSEVLFNNLPGPSMIDRFGYTETRPALKLTFQIQDALMEVEFAEQWDEFCPKYYR